MCVRTELNLSIWLNHHDVVVHLQQEEQSAYLLAMCHHIMIFQPAGGVQHSVSAEAGCWLMSVAEYPQY